MELYKLLYIILYSIHISVMRPRVIGNNAHGGVSKSFRTGRLERELQVVQFSASRRSCIAILWFSLASFAVIILCVASQLVFIVAVVCLVIDSVRKLLNTPSYIRKSSKTLLSDTEASCFFKRTTTVVFASRCWSWWVTFALFNQITWIKQTEE
jgi:hypothetical protein